MPSNRDKFSDRKATPMERFRNRVVPDSTTGCWEFLGTKTPKGYHQFHADGESRAHRFAFKSFKGAIPEGMVVDHLCRNRGCVNPDHLELKTVGGNIHAVGSEALAAINAAKTLCPRGHAFDYVDPRGRRRCKRCAADRVKAAYHANGGMEKQRAKRAAAKGNK